MSPVSTDGSPVSGRNSLNKKLLSLSPPLVQSLLEIRREWRVAAGLEKQEEGAAAPDGTKVAALAKSTGASASGLGAIHTKQDARRQQPGVSKAVVEPVDIRRRQMRAQSDAQHVGRSMKVHHRGATWPEGGARSHAR